MDTMYLGQPVLGFAADGDYLDCILGNDIVKIDRTAHVIINKKTLFYQKGLARDLVSDKDYLYQGFLSSIHFNKRELLIGPGPASRH